MKKILAYILSFILTFLSMGVFAIGEGIYIYNAKITNINADRVRLSLTGSGRNLPVGINFVYGTVSLSGYYTSAKVYTEGKSAYMSVPDGEEFLFTLRLNTTSGEVSVFINSEPCISAQYNIFKNIAPSPTWFLNNNSSSAIADDTSVKISDAESFYLSSSSQNISAINAYDTEISLKFNHPLSYDEILKIKASDSSGENVKICDISKTSENVTLKFSKKLNTGEKYTISGEEISDIYGESFSFSKEFIPSAKDNTKKIALYQYDDFGGYTYTNGVILENTKKEQIATATGNVKSKDGASIDTLWTFTAGTSLAQIGLETVTKNAKDDTALYISQKGSASWNNTRFAVRQDVAKKIYTDGYRYAVLKADIKNGTSSQDVVPGIRFFRSEELDLSKKMVAGQEINQYGWNEYIFIIDRDDKCINVVINGVLAPNSVTPTDYFNNFAGLNHSGFSVCNYASPTAETKIWFDDVSLYGANSLEAVIEKGEAENILTDKRGEKISFTTEFTNAENSALSSCNAKILDFETPETWRTETDFLGDNPDMPQSDLAINSKYEEQTYNMPYVTEKKSSGNYALKWDNHPYYPTLSAKLESLNIMGKNEVKFWIYSEKITRETIMLYLVCDNPKTLWKDGYFYPVVIDFMGEKEISIPLKDFYRFNEPTDFSYVSQIHFAAKMFENTPNPETVIYLDNIRFSYNEDYPLTPFAKIYTKKSDNHRGTVYDWSLLNHNFPEVQKNAEINTDENTFIRYDAYYKAERALYGYFPKYAPSVPSFDSKGNAYFYKSGRILWLDDKGKWNTVDLEKEFLKHWGDRGYYFSIYDQMSSDETVIRFDDDGGVYVAMTVYAVPYLFYSADGMESWKCYNLSRSTGISTENASSQYIRFERIEAHNKDAGKFPPAIIYGNYVLIPQKTEADGLTFKTVKYGENMLGHNNHSGDGNSVITIGNNIYVVYAKYGDYLTTDEKNALPDENSSANQLTWVDDGVTFYSKDGTKAFIRRINRETLEVSAPVFAGYGGHTQDDHNWPNMTVDSEKRLHVFVNGHHDPIYYSYTLNGVDLSAWSEPILFSKAKDDSYASIVTDKDDTIYVLTRDSGRGYHFDLSLYTKKKNETTFTHDYLVQKRFAYYKVWRNRLSLDPVSNKLYVCYYSQSGSEELFKEHFDAYIYTWPDKERYFIKRNGIPAYGENKRWYDTTIDDSGFEGTVLVSSDSGKTFNLAQTSDFKGQNRQICETLAVSFKENVAEVKIKSNKNVTANVFLGVYDDGGKLIDILKQPKSLTIGDDNTVTFENLTGAKNVKAFLWDDKLTPFAEMKESE